MLAFSSDWTTLAGWRGLKTRLNSLRYTKGRVRQAGRAPPRAHWDWVSVWVTRVHTTLEKRINRLRKRPTDRRRRSGRGKL